MCAQNQEPSDRGQSGLEVHVGISAFKFSFSIGFIGEKVYANLTDFFKDPLL